MEPQGGLKVLKHSLTHESLNEEVQINVNGAPLDQGEGFNIYNSSAHFKTLSFFSWVMIFSHATAYNQDKNRLRRPALSAPRSL